MSQTAVTLNDRTIDFDAAVALMDGDLREELHALGFEAGEEQAFLDAYVEAHAAKFGGEEFSV